MDNHNLPSFLCAVVPHISVDVALNSDYSFLPIISVYSSTIFRLSSIFSVSLSLSPAMQAYGDVFSDQNTTGLIHAGQLRLSVLLHRN